MGGVVGGVTVFGVSLVAIFFCCRRKRATALHLLGERPQRSSGTLADPYLATLDQYPAYNGKHGVKFVRYDGDSSLVAKHQHTLKGGSLSSDDVDSNISCGSLIPTPVPATVQDVERSGDDGTVRVDAGALQRLLLNMGGALSEVQYRSSSRHSSGPSSELPPDYEENPGGRS